MNSKSYKTVKAKEKTSLKIKGSEFIGLLFPVETESESEAILKTIRKEYYDATHHCYAYSIYDNNFKYSDDGEPGGSAGIRIYNAIKHFDLTNVLVIVVRYFGGTKLGVGPLGKAYYQSAYDTINSAKIIKKYLYSKIMLNYDYDHTSLVHHLLNKYSAIRIKNYFSQKPSIECLINPEMIDKLKPEIKNGSGNMVKVSTIEEDIPVSEEEISLK